MKILDDVLPEHKRTESLDEHDDHEADEGKEQHDAAGSGDGGETGNDPSYPRKQQYKGHTGMFDDGVVKSLTIEC